MLEIPSIIGSLLTRLLQILNDKYDKSKVIERVESAGTRICCCPVQKVDI